MPSGLFSTPRYLSIENMINKKTWRTSLKAVNYKAHKLGLISDLNRSNLMKLTLYIIEERRNSS
jgi:hypothetical protein